MVRLQPSVRGICMVKVLLQVGGILVLVFFAQLLFLRWYLYG